MTLRRKMGLQITSMIVGLLLISGASLWGLNGLRQDYGDAVKGYLELRQIFEIGLEVSLAKTFMAVPEPDPEHVEEHMQNAVTRFEAARPGSPLEGAAYQPLRAALNEAQIEVRVWRQTRGPAPTGAINNVLKKISDTVAGLRGDVETEVAASQAAAEAKRRTTLSALGLLCGAVILAGALMGLWQYKGVLNPLHRLSGAVRRVATGHFGVRILESGMPRGGDNEFATLAADFNRMAEKLDGYYRDLEQKVAAKSKELIRSERLASVGYLAAGVAHEINNPLGIISGYAEYALAEMQQRRGGGTGTEGSVATSDIDTTLRVIRDEAFRCKDITSKLLSLARPGDGQRQHVNLADVAENVVSVLAGLRDFKERKITVRSETREAAPVVDAIEGEMKQVLMNLLINALEATDNHAGDGEVRVTVSRSSEPASGQSTVTLAVSDNGRGMTPDTLEHVFEPFFTERRPRDPDSPPRPGTGLGLSITHAIVQAHRGRITAHSDGPGRGSRFVIELPAAREESASFTQGKA